MPKRNAPNRECYECGKPFFTYDGETVCSVCRRRIQREEDAECSGMDSMIDTVEYHMSDEWS